MILYVGWGVALFGVGVVLDTIYALHMKAIADNRLWQAVAGGMLTAAMGMSGVLSIIELSLWYAIPFIAGLGVGNGLFVWQQQRKRGFMYRISIMGADTEVSA